MKIELKNIKYAAFASHDSHCYTATLYVDGQKLCQVSDDGYGGEPSYHGIRGGVSQQDVYKRISEIDSLDIACCDLLNDWLRKRDFKKQMKKITLISDGNVQFYKALAPTPENIALVKASPDWNKDDLLLNEMPEGEAFKLFVEATTPKNI